MVEGKELEPTLKRTLSVWWLLAWRGTLIGALMGAAVGFVIGLMWYALSWSPQHLQTVTGILGGCIGLVWGFFVLRMAFRKQYNGFRIALVPANAQA